MQLTQQQQPEQPDFGKPSQGAEQDEQKSDTVEEKPESDTVAPQDQVQPAQGAQEAEPAQPAQAAEPAQGDEVINKSLEALDFGTPTQVIYTIE